MPALRPSLREHKLWDTPAPAQHHVESQQPRSGWRHQKQIAHSLPSGKSGGMPTPRRTLDRASAKNAPELPALPRKRKERAAAQQAAVK